MGLFDSLRDALHPEGHPEPAEKAEAAPGPKHLDDSATSEFVNDPGEREQPTGGKHARRDGVTG